MSDSPPIAETSRRLEAAHDRTPGPEEASALLAECGREFRSRLFEATRASLDLASDLFESTTGIPDGEIESFRAKRGEWLERFERADMKAALRARSEFRPADDKDLLPTFSRMLSEVGALPTDIAIPALSGPGGPATTSGGASTTSTDGAVAAMTAAGGAATKASAAAANATYLPAPAILSALAALAELAKGRSAAEVATASPAPGGDFPDLDPMMALGTSTPLFATLGHWQRLDLPVALQQALPPQVPGDTALALPQNLVPHIRAAVAGQVENPADRIAMDVIALLFDYVFRDPSIPDPMRTLFGRLQVPIVKAALLDRAFFSDRRHPALLLNHLAEGAVGATAEDAYCDAFEAAATRVVDNVCRDFEIDVAVFARADADLVAFLESERRESAPALNNHVAVALAAEESEADRSQVRALVRDRLAGLDLPFDVRTFAETVWADYLTMLHQDPGPDSEAWRGALTTLDDLLWSIVIKERTAQKEHLTKMIPRLVMGLRRGCTAVALESDRAKSFFDALYVLHMAALKPAAAANAAQPTADGGAKPATATCGRELAGASAVPTNVHDS